MLDDEEPEWESIGYRRDLGKQPPAPLKPKPPLPDALVAHSRLRTGDQKTADVYQTYVLDLTDTDDNLREAAQQLEAKSLNDRTTYVRMVVWNFAGTRMRALRHFLAKLPLVRELLLPDRDYCPFHLLTVMELINRHLYNKCPRLQWMVFRDGTADTLYGAKEVLQSPVSRVHNASDPWSVEWQPQDHW